MQVGRVGCSPRKKTRSSTALPQSAVSAGHTPSTGHRCADTPSNLISTIEHMQTHEYGLNGYPTVPFVTKSATCELESSAYIQPTNLIRELV